MRACLAVHDHTHGHTCPRIGVCPHVLGRVCTPVLVYPMVWPTWALAPGLCSVCLAFPVPQKVPGPSQNAYAGRFDVISWNGVQRSYLEPSLSGLRLLVDQMEGSRYGGLAQGWVSQERALVPAGTWHRRVAPSTPVGPLGGH